MDKILTVFTPAYNRAYTLYKCYESLTRQTNKDFKWMIIDDGSTDNTSDLVAKWKEESDFEIIYIYKQNGGMHTAHNTAYENIDTELNVCIDSDDYLTDDAVEIIVTEWEKIRSKKLAGLGAGCPILAITDNKRTFHQLALAWNVTPIYVEAGATIEETIDKGIEKLKNKEILEKGDVVVLSGGAKTFSSGMTKKVIGGILRID